MNNENILSRAELYRRNKRRNALWKRVIAILGCAVLFITTYVLVLPAVTLDDPPICGYEEHRHDSSCYMLPDPVSQLSCSVTPHQHTDECEQSCGYADFFLHSHSTDNGDSGHFVCKLPELEVHTHTDECYAESAPLVCGIEESEGHTHGDGCFTEISTLTCTEPEATPHTHEDACYGEDGALVCTVEESEGHSHDDACFTAASTLTCEIPEDEGHTHSDACLGEPEKVLTCTEPEYTLHTHTDDCFDADGVWICGIVELVEHIHGESCLATTEVHGAPVLICEQTEHIHTDACYPALEDTTAETSETESTVSADPTDSTLVTDPTESALVTEPVDFETIEKTAVIYTDETYLEVSADTTVITVTGLIPADAEIRAYPVTVQSEKDVLCAYDLTIFLPDGTVFEPAEGENLTVSILAPDLSGEVYYIPENGDPELIDTTVTEDGVKFDTGHFSVYAVMAVEDSGLKSEAVPTGAAGSYWHSTAYPIYQSSPMRYRRGMYACWAETYILVSQDEYAGQTWTPDSIEWTAAGNHNYVVCYCADYNNAVRDGGGVSYIYKRLLSDAGFTVDQQAALRRIITNAYPFITLDEMIQQMNAAGYTGDFNATNVLFGTQNAIWSITDGKTVSLYDSKVADTDDVLNPITSTSGVSESVANTVYDYLINAAVDKDPGSLSVTNTIWNSNDGSYSVTITLNRALKEGESLEATLSNGETSVTQTIEAGTKQFTMVWSAGLPETGNITLSLSGSRQKFNVYHYDDDGEYQNLISGEYDLVEMNYKEVLVRSTTNVTVVKNWVETDPSTRPSELIVYLTINGSHVVEDGVSPIVLSESNNWTYTWTDLPTFKNGTALNYSVDEVTPAGYSGKFVTETSDGDKTITITNTQIPVALQTSVSVSKQWEDGNSTHSGQAIIVHLYADGVYTGKDLVMSDATNWFVTFDGLPYYREDGVTPIEYTIVEEKVEGYVPDYGDTTPIPNETTWEQTTALEAGSVYRFVSNGVALSCDANGNLTATSDATEDKYQWWSVAKSGSSWTLTNVATGKMVGFSNKTYVSADSGVALTFSSNRLSYKSGGILGIGATTYYLSLSEGSAATTTSSSSASTFAVYKKTSIDKVPAYNITLTNRLAPTYELPQTGGVGTEIFTFGGIATIAAALMWGCSHKRKRERGAV